MCARYHLRAFGGTCCSLLLSPPGGADPLVDPTLWGDRCASGSLRRPALRRRQFAVGVLFAELVNVAAEIGSEVLNRDTPNQF